MGSVGLSDVCSGRDDGGLDILDSDIEGLGQGFECLLNGNSLHAPGLPPDVCGDRHVRSSSEGAGAKTCRSAQASQVGRSPGLEEVCCRDVQGLGQAVEYFGPWGGTAELPA